MVFNPEDKQDFGPHCRNCHKGSSRCAGCHNTGTSGAVRDYSQSLTAANTTNKSTYTLGATSDGQMNHLVASGLPAGSSATTSNVSYGFFKKSRTVTWGGNWRTSAVDQGEPGKDSVLASGGACSDDGFSWPHRTLGFKMLKDDLFGLNFDGTPVAVGVARTGQSGSGYVAHDIDSVCLDCHNPNTWNATSASHVDSPTNDNDNNNDELLTRGLP